MYKDLLIRLNDYAEWADANEYEVPIDLGLILRDAVSTIQKLSVLVEQLEKELRIYEDITYGTYNSFDLPETDVNDGDSLYW